MGFPNRVEGGGVAPHLLVASANDLPPSLQCCETYGHVLAMKTNYIITKPGYNIHIRLDIFYWQKPFKQMRRQFL